MFPLMSTKILREAAKTASFVVRLQPAGKAEFFIEMALNEEIVHRVRTLFVEKVTPLLVIASTSHGGTAYFDPEKLRFEQEARSWQPRRASEGLDIVPADYRQRFGGALCSTDVHLGFILVPQAFDFNHPVAVHYGDFFLGLIPRAHNGHHGVPQEPNLEH